MSRLMRFLRQDCGVAAMEFALILPLLLTIIGGIIEYGRVLFAENAIRAIIDETARNAVVRSLSTVDVEVSVLSDVGAVPGIEDFDVDVSDGAALTITVSGTFDFVFVGLLPGDLRNAIGFSLTARYPR